MLSHIAFLCHETGAWERKSNWMIKSEQLPYELAPLKAQYCHLCCNDIKMYVTCHLEMIAHDQKEQKKI